VSRGIVRSVGRPVVINHAVVGTITLTSVLIIYDGWASLRFGDVVAIIVGPVLAIFIARAFGETLAKLAATDGPLNRSELLGVVRAECGFLLLAVPPIALIAILDLAGMALGNAIQIVIWLGAASLGFWGGLAGVRAGLRGRSLALAVAIGFLVGGLVLTLRVILQPEKVISNGVAMTRFDEAGRPRMQTTASAATTRADLVPPRTLGLDEHQSSVVRLARRPLSQGEGGVCCAPAETLAARPIRQCLT
jgi:hypothetical protein